MRFCQDNLTFIVMRRYFVLGTFFKMTLCNNLFVILRTLLYLNDIPLKMLVHIVSFSLGILDGFYNRQYFLLICRSSPLQKSSKILSVSSLWFIDFTGSFTVLINCASQDGYFLKPCCGLFTMLFFFRCFMILLCNTCSKTLYEMDAWRTGM